jgi:hypothetical protein
MSAPSCWSKVVVLHFACFKFVKKSKTKAKKPKTTHVATKKAEPASAATSKKPTTAPKPEANSFFAFGNKGDSDSESDNEAKTSSGTPAAALAPTDAKPVVPDEESPKEFKLKDGIGDELVDDEDADLEKGEEIVAAKWNMSKPDSPAADADSDGEVGEEDDAWGAAREHAAASKAREAERKAREEKLKEEAKLAEKQRLADLAVRGEELKAQRLEEKEKEERLREKQAEETRKAAREAARAQVQSVEQTVDLDAQRDIMKQYEQSFLDKDVGSASPSSDFGF